LLDKALGMWSGLVDPALADAPGAGAAGGIGFAALAVLGATRRSGIDLLLDLVGFAAHLPGAALVITGEGSLDEQSLHGKAPIGVVDAAINAGVRAVAVAGPLPTGRATLTAAGITAAYALTDIDPTRPLHGRRRPLLNNWPSASAGTGCEATTWRFAPAGSSRRRGSGTVSSASATAGSPCSPTPALDAPTTSTWPTTRCCCPACGQSRARQRARPHRMGRLRHRQPGPPRPVASPRSSTCP